MIFPNIVTNLHTSFCYFSSIEIGFTKGNLNFFFFTLVFRMYLFPKLYFHVKTQEKRSFATFFYHFSIHPYLSCIYSSRICPSRIYSSRCFFYFLSEKENTVSDVINVVGKLVSKSKRRPRADKIDRYFFVAI